MIDLGATGQIWPVTFTNQAQPCLASVGNQSWATEWYGCWLLL